MAIINVLAVSAVADMDLALAWYERLFGRPADERPMDEAAEWKLDTGGGLQVVLAPEQAGQSMTTLAVDDIEELVADLKSRGISAKASAPGDGPYRLVRIKDQDGNMLTFAETQVSTVSLLRSVKRG